MSNRRAAAWLERLELPVLAASAIAFLWVSSYVTPIRLTPSVLLAALAVGLAGLHVLRRGKLDLPTEFRWLLVVAGVLLAWAAVVYGFSGNYPEGLWRLLQIALGMAVASSVVVMVNSRARALYFLCALLVGFVVSAGVGIGQHFAGEPFVRLWEAVGGGPQSAPGPGQSAPGLAPTTIFAGYQLAVAFPLALSVLLSRHVSGRKGTGAVLILGLVAIALGLVVTGSRSAVGAGVIGGVFVLLLLRFNKRRRLVGPLVAALGIGVALYFAVGMVYDPGRFVQLEGRSAQVRGPMQATALNYALRHPLGTGVYRPDESYIPAGVEPHLQRMIVGTATHNQFLNVLTYYGFPGLVLLILFYGLVVRQLWRLWHGVARGASERTRWLVAGCAGAVLAYLLNSLLHNAGPFVGDWFHWYVIGLLFSLRWTEGTVAGAAEGTGGPGNGG